MPLYPINWELVLDEDNDCFYDDSLRLTLNSEWTIACLPVRKYHRFEIIVKIAKFCRKSTTRAITVSGALTLKANGCSVSEKEFSLLVEAGSSSAELCSYSINWPSINKTYSLHGYVNIPCINEKSSANLANGKCKKCIQMTSLEELSSNFERLLDPKTACFADVTLKCGGASIPAHKNILSTRSPVFAAMFANPMKESRQNEVDVIDMKVSVLRTMLTYMYTGKCSGLTDQSASDLLFAADKYQLLDLKRVCSDFLKSAISPQNVLTILVLGDLHDEDLKSFAVDYVCNKCPEFSVLEKAEEWKTMRKERPALTIDVLISLVKSRDEKLKR